MDGTLEQRPMYFFDQPTFKKRGNKNMRPGEQLSDFSSVITNPNETGCFHRNSGCMEEHMEGIDTSVKNNIAKRDPASPQIHGPSVFRTISEDPLAQLCQAPSQPLTEKVLQSALLYEYKCMALNILCELEEMLNHFSKYKLILPQGILNILTYSWKELVEGACYNKTAGQELAYKHVQSGRRQTLEKCNRLSPTSENTETAESKKRQCRSNVGFPTGVAKGPKNPKTLLNRLSGKKTAVSQQDTSDSPVAISFSLSSKMSGERGVFQQSDSKDLEWKAPYIWAVERLQLAKIQIVEQLSKLKKSGFDKPLILCHYGDVKKEQKNIKGWPCKRISSEVLNEKPQLPVIKQPEPAFKKLHYGLLDGSSLIYYPSGHFAVCQSYSNLPCGGMYTNIFNDFPDRGLLGTFTPFGHGSVCFPNSNNIAMIFNQEGGMVTNQGGEILRKWKWPGVRKLGVPVIIQVNKYITVRIAGRFAVCLIYKWHHESVRLSLSPVRGVSVPQLENLTSRIPKEDLSQVKDFTATRELRQLRKKIKTILEDWLEYYRKAFAYGRAGVGGKCPGSVSPGNESYSRRTLDSFPGLELEDKNRCSFPRAEGITSRHRTSTIPPQAGRQHEKLLVGASPHVLTSQRGKSKDSEAHVSYCPLRFQPAPVCSPIQDVTFGYSRAPPSLSSIFKMNQLFMTHVNKEKPISQISSKASEKLWSISHTACPAALRRSMLGDKGKICGCSNHQIPYVTDLEYYHIINNPVSSPEQITVVCVTSSLRAADYGPSLDKHLEHLYERKNKNRSMPCTQGCLDSFRLLKYDINTADEFTGHCGSLLVKRHNVFPGMFLMYIQGKLLFANYMFNGYSNSVKDLQKQIALTRCVFERGYYLPPDYRFSSLENSLQSYSEHAQARIPEDVSRCIYYPTERRESAHDFQLFSLYRGATSFGTQK